MGESVLEVNKKQGFFFLIFHHVFPCLLVGLLYFVQYPSYFSSLSSLLLFLLPSISSALSLYYYHSRLWWCHGKTWWNIRQKTLFFVPLQHWFTHKRIKLLRLSPQCWKMTLESTIFQLFFQVTVVVQQFLSLTKKMYMSQLASSVGVKIVEMQKTPMSCSSFLFTSSGFIKFATDIDWLWCKMSSLLCINYWMIQITNNVAIYCLDKKKTHFLSCKILILFLYLELKNYQRSKNDMKKSTIQDQAELCSFNGLAVALNQSDLLFSEIRRFSMV